MLKGGITHPVTDEGTEAKLWKTQEPQQIQADSGKSKQIQVQNPGLQTSTPSNH